MDKRLAATIVTTITCFIVAVVAQYFILPNDTTGVGPNIGLGMLISASWLLFVFGFILIAVQAVKLYRSRK